MGGYCQEKGTCAPDFVRAMRDHARAADAAEAAFDHCGPGRFLGQLILGTLDYPGYSIGDLDDSIEALRRAHASCPDFPENGLGLAEALIEDGDDDEAAALLRRVLASTPPADHTAEHARWVERARELLDEL